jgi:putative Holliday junction resolvase
MGSVRKRWKIKPFSRIKESEKIYRRSSEKETVRKSEGESEGRILALDFGMKRVGVAISDPLRLTAHGLKTLVGKTIPEMLTLVESIVREQHAVEIVVGHPLLMSGAEGDLAEATREFASELERQLSVPVVLWDERLSSREAERILKDRKQHRKKEDIDRISACLILQSYLDKIAG